MIDNMVIISCLAREGGGLKCKNGSVGLEYVVVSQAWTDDVENIPALANNTSTSPQFNYSSCFHKTDNP